eukprot:superscaffoldBa00002875_g15539
MSRFQKTPRLAKTSLLKETQAGRSRIDTWSDLLDGGTGEDFVCFLVRSVNTVKHGCTTCHTADVLVIVRQDFPHIGTVKVSIWVLILLPADDHMQLVKCL